MPARKPPLLRLPRCAPALHPGYRTEQPPDPLCDDGMELFGLLRRRRMAVIGLAFVGALWPIWRWQR